MLWVLLKKDLRRALRKPSAYAVMLALPLAITALIGLAFGSASETGLPRIQVAYVDRDGGLLGGLLSSAFGQGQLADMVELAPMAEEAARARLADNDCSAVLIVPEGFTNRFFEGGAAPPLELVKNPAERFLPAIVEEIVLTMTEGLNAVSRNFSAELSELRDLLADERTPEPLMIAGFSQRVAERVQAAEPYLFPPLIGYAEAARERPDEEPEVDNLFAYLLPAMSSLFLLFLADTASRDLFEENRVKALDRYRTLRFDVTPLILSKALLAAVVVAFGAAILFLGGGLIFAIDWRQPLAAALLTLGYSLFCAGFVALLTSLLAAEQRANTVNGLLFMGLGFLGGSFIGVDSLPDAIADYIAPLTPNHWFIQAMNRLQFGMDGPQWTAVAAILAGVGLMAAAAGGAIWNRRMAKGVRP